MLLNVGTGLMLSARGLAPRALRDIKAATCAGRFDVADPDLALALAAGALLGLGQLLHDQPERDDAAASDQMAENLLRVYGVPAHEAEEICRRPLPVVDELIRPAVAQQAAATGADATLDDSRNVGARL